MGGGARACRPRDREDVCGPRTLGRLGPVLRLEEHGRGQQSDRTPEKAADAQGRIRADLQLLLHGRHRRHTEGDRRKRRPRRAACGRGARACRARHSLGCGSGRHERHRLDHDAARHGEGLRGDENEGGTRGRRRQSREARDARRHGRALDRAASRDGRRVRARPRAHASGDGQGRPLFSRDPHDGLRNARGLPQRTS